MADYVWTGAIDEDLDKPGNYTVGGVTAATVPTAADTLSLDGGEVYLFYFSGTSHAGMVTATMAPSIYGGTFHGDMTLNGELAGGTYYGDVNFTDGGISGGTFYGPVYNPIYINDGTFNGLVSDDNKGVMISGGIFNGDVSSMAYGQFSGGTYNGNVHANSFVDYGTFNGPLKLTGFCVSQGSVLDITDRVSFDDGATWLYTSTSPAVAASSVILAGNSNLGTTGSATLPDAVDVKNGVTYGVGGTGSTGLLVAPRKALTIGAGICF